jgi:hypothetical protein
MSPDALGSLPGGCPIFWLAAFQRVQEKKCYHHRRRRTGKWSLPGHLRPGRALAAVAFPAKSQSPPNQERHSDNDSGHCQHHHQKHNYVIALKPHQFPKSVRTGAADCTSACAGPWCGGGYGSHKRSLKYDG